MSVSTTPTSSLSYTELTSVDIGAGPHFHIAYSGVTNQVWVLNAGSRSISVLDGDTGALAKTVQLDGAPRHIIIDDAADRAYLTLENDAVSVVRVSDGNGVQTVGLPEGSRPYVLVPHPLAARMFVLNDGNGTFTTIDTANLSVFRTVSVGLTPSWGQPHKKAAGKIHVTNRGSDSVSVIDEKTGEVTATVPTGKGPNRNGVYRERNAMYTANLGDNTLTGISIADDSVVGTAHLDIDPFRLVPADKKTGRSEIWVLGRGNETNPGGIVTVNSETHEISERLETVANPANWLFEGSVGQVVATSSREMKVFDCKSVTVIGEATLSHDPDLNCHSNMVLTKDHKLFLCNADDTVTVFAVKS
jgi:YVTN family beta-propeller protein